MKHLIKLVLFGAGMLFALLALYGCLSPTAPFLVEVTPDSGHPPFAVTITAQDKGGGTYTYEATGEAAVQSTEHVYKTVVHEWPWECRVTWTDGDSVAEATAHVALNNTGPTIYRPRIANWYGASLERTLIDCTYREEAPLWPGYVPVVTGIKDPDGDTWTLTAISVQCALLDKPDTLFYPPYMPGVYHADGIDNAAIWYPTYVATIEPISGLPYPPYPETGYPFDPCLDNGVPKMPSQTAVITITAEDEFGASTTKSFTIPVGAAGCSK